MNTRREFLCNCTALAAAIIAPPANAIGQILRFHPSHASLDQLSFAQWSAQLHTSFRVQAGPGNFVILKLIQAALDAPSLQHGRRPPPDVHNERFSLVFSGPNDEKLPQETFRFAHDQLGRFDLFIVPVFTRNPHVTKYTAVLNCSRQNVTKEQIG